MRFCLRRESLRDLLFNRQKKIRSRASLSSGVAIFRITLTSELCGSKSNLGASASRVYQSFWCALDIKYAFPSFFGSIFPFRALSTHATGTCLCALCTINEMNCVSEQECRWILNFDAYPFYPQHWHAKDSRVRTLLSN